MRTYVIIALIIACLIFSIRLFMDWRLKRKHPRYTVTWREGGLVRPADHYRRFAEQVFASNFDPEVTSDRITGKHPALAWPYGGPAIDPANVHPRCALCNGLDSIHAFNCPAKIAAEIATGATGNVIPFPRNAFCPGCDAPQPGPHSYDCYVRIERSRMPVDDDSGEPMPAALSAPPNIGGEDHPAYAGPHYNSLHQPASRYIPYDMLHDPVHGAAVIPVKDGFGITGPIKDEGEKT